MSGGFGAWLVSPLGTAVLDFILFAAGLAIGLGLGWGRGRDRAYEDGYDQACDDAEWIEHDRRIHLIDRQRLTRPELERAVIVMEHAGQLEVAHEWEPVHVGQAIALVRDDLTDSAYTEDMAARMDRFLEGLLRVPYSADELWTGQ